MRPRLMPVAVALALLLFGGSPAAVAAEASEEPAAAAQGLLDIRTRALAEGDRDAYMATIDPRAADSFRTAQGVSFDGLRSAPLVDYSVRVRLDDSGNLAAGLDLAKKYKANRAFLPETRQSYRLGTYDDRPAVDSLWFTYVERDGRWYINGDSDLDEIGLQNGRQLWDFGPVALTQTPHFLVLTKQSQTERGQALASIAEEAMGRLDSQWARPWSEKLPIIVPGSAAEARSLLAVPIDVNNFVAFVTYTPIREAGWNITAPRMYAQDAQLAKQDRAKQVDNVTHELTHAATAPISGPFMPTWLHEGLAEFIRLGSPTDLRPPPGHSNELPTSEDFKTGDNQRLVRSYAESAAVVSYIARTWGGDAPARLFEAIGVRSVVPGSPSHNVDFAVRQVLGVSLDELESGALAT